MVRQIRAAHPDLPLILMTYYNPLLRYGLERYAHDAQAAGADAHIVTDLTPEEAGEWKRAFRSERSRHGISARADQHAGAHRDRREICRPASSTACRARASPERGRTCRPN